MSSSKVVGRLRAVLGLDKRNFQQGLRDGESDLKRFSSVAQAVGGRLKMALGLSVAGFGLQQLVAQATAAVRAVAALGDEAKRAGMSVEAFQEWKFVAEQNRIGIDALVDGFKELNLRADEFIETGGGSAADAFKRLGFSAQDLKNKLKDPSALMLEIIGRLEGLDKSAQIRISDELLGGAGGEQFVQVLEQGEAGIRKTIDTAHEAGAVLDRQMIQKADELDRKWKELTTTVGGWFDNVATGWAVIATGAAEALAAVAGMKHAVDDLLSDESRARTVLGNAIYDRISEGKKLTEDQKDMLEDIERVTQMSLPAIRQMASVFKGIAGTMAETNPKLAEDLAAIAQNMEALAFQLENNMIEADEFHSRMGDLITDARTATGELNNIDSVGFSTVIGGLERLAGMLGYVAEKGREARESMPSPVTPATPLQGGADANMPPTFNSGITSSPRPGARPESWAVDMDGDGVPDALQTGKTAGGRGGGGGKSRDEYAAAIESSRQQVAMLTAETAAFLAAAASGGKYGGSVDYAKKKAELLMAAQKQGLAITPALTAEIDAQAKAYATAGLAAEEAADKLREIDEAMERGEDTARDFFGALLDGSDAAKNAIISLLAEMAKAQFASGALGLLGSFGGGGFLKSFGTLLGGGIPIGANSTGTLSWRGGLSRINELGGEIIDLPKGSRVIPADVSKRMADQSGAQAVDVHVTVGMDESGNLQVRNIARQEASSVAGELNRALPSRIAEINARNPRMRG